jgi:hypothetical protein
LGVRNERLAYIPTEGTVSLETRKNDKRRSNGKERRRRRRRRRRRVEQVRQC